MKISIVFSMVIFLLSVPVKNFAGVINVKKFGAKGDGRTDDTKAIQAAINAAPALKNTIIYFPKGTYLAGSYSITYNYQENYCLRIHSGITFKGDGNKSVIRLASHLFDKTDSTANAHLFFGSQIQDVKFTGLLLDMNGMNNLVPQQTIKNHTAIYIRNGKNVSIQNITIKNCAGRDMIIISGKGSNAIIETSTFLNGGNYTGSSQPNKYQNDFSFLYTEWDSVIIRDNRIEQQNIDIALDSYSGGIEIHGSYCLASGNRITGCNPGIYLSSSYHTMEKTTVENNQFINCIKGISFWVNFPVNNISIQKNNIQLTYSRLLKPSVLSGIEIPNGNAAVYEPKQANNAPLTYILIAYNTISAILRPGSTDKTVGMVLHSLQQSTISNNTITGMNYGGILIQGSKWGSDSVIVTKNTFTNFESNSDANAASGYIIITDTYSGTVQKAPGMKNIFFSSNEFIRSQPVLKNTTRSVTGGKFFGAFIALPESMHSQIHFDKNVFTDENEKVYFLKTK